MVLLENNYGKVRCKTCDSVFQLEKGGLEMDSYRGGYVLFQMPCLRRNNVV